MSTKNIYTQADEARRLESSRILEQLSRDIRDALKEPTKTKRRATRKFVAKGLSDSEYRKFAQSEDSKLASNIEKFGPRRLGNAFGPNKGMDQIEMELRRTLGSRFHGTKALNEYAELSTQVICHLLIQAAINMTNASSSSALLQTYKRLERVGIGFGSQRLTQLIAKENGQTLFAGKVYEMLYPFDLEHIRDVENAAATDYQLAGPKLQYLANADAQAAVLTYLGKKAPAADVLLPGAIGGNTSAEVRKAFEQFPGKSVDATYAYYQAAVNSERDARFGVRTGNVEGSLRAAQRGIESAIKELSGTYFSKRVMGELKSQLKSVAKKIRGLKANSTNLPSDIASVVADLLNVIGGANGVGSGSSTTLVDAANCFGGQTALQNAVLNDILPFINPFPMPSMTMAEDIEVLDAQDEIRPADVTKMESGLDDASAVREGISLTFQALAKAYGEVNIGSTISVRPVAPKVLSATTEFKRLVDSQIQLVQDNINSSLAGMSGVDRDGLTAGILDAYADVLNVLQYRSGGSGIVPLDSLSVNVSNWVIPAPTYNKIADGNIPSLKSRSADGRTIQESVEDAVNRHFASTSRRTNSNVRRATRDAAIRGTEKLILTLQGLRIQAESQGMQIRSNPAGLFQADTALKKVGVGAGALVSDHATASLINRFAAPKAGSIGAHAADYGTSVATALWATTYLTGTRVPVLNSNGIENKALGASMLGGAVGHVALRYIFKNNIGGARFSENPVLKALQYPTNGVACLLGDESMGVSAACPANVEKHKDNIIQYAADLARVNPACVLPMIALQFAAQGAMILPEDSNEVIGKVDPKLTSMSVEDFLKVLSPAEDADETAQAGAIVARTLVATNVAGFVALSHFCCMEDFKVENGVASVKDPDDALAHEKKLISEVNAALLCLKNQYPDNKGIAEIHDKATQVESTGAFILEPGYNMDIYSGEDQVNYLHPAPRATYQSGLTQLEDAIARAQELTPTDKMQEGIGDLRDVSVILVTPRLARAAEDAGMGTSLGQSRKNPAGELFAVEGANGLMPVAPERQFSVPQGALNHAKIGHAPNIDVSPRGLFNHGVFTPGFGGS